jgi:hypothetical protein
VEEEDVRLLSPVIVVVSVNMVVVSPVS